MGIYTDETGKKITGAGVIVVEEYRSKDNKVIPAILVARNRSSKLVSDFGGTYSEKHQTLQNAASDELREESRNLIDIPGSILEDEKHFDISGAKDTHYRVFVIKARNISSKYYNHNKKIIDSHPKSKKQWKETDKIHHIPIKSIDFDSLLERKPTIIADVHGDRVKLHMRLRKALHHGRELILEAVKESDELVNKSDLVVEGGGDFKKGTYVFRLEKDK